MKTRNQAVARRRLSNPVIRPMNDTRESSTGLLSRNLKIQSILVPIDFSHASKKAVKYAEALARQFNAQITLLHIIEPMPMADFGAYPLALAYDQVLKETKQTLDGFGRREVPAKLLKETHVSVGRPFQEITDAARKLNVDLIVIATHGHTGLTRAILGSTAERVVRYAPCPVLTVRDKESKSARGRL